MEPHPMSTASGGYNSPTIIDDSGARIMVAHSLDIVVTFEALCANPRRPNRPAGHARPAARRAGRDLRSAAARAAGRPRCPIERFNRTLAYEWAFVRAYPSE